MAPNKNIRNYTSEVPARNSINKIEELIVSAGARQVIKTYDEEGNISGFKFLLPINNMQLTFDINPRVEKVYQNMLDRYKTSPTKDMMARTHKQAERTSWKNQAELLEIQLDMVACDQVDMMEALFLSLTDGKETVYDKIKNTGYKALLPQAQ